MSWPGDRTRLSELASSRSGSASTEAQTYVKKNNNNKNYNNNSEKIQVNVVSGKKNRFLRLCVVCLLVSFFYQQTTGLRCLFFPAGRKKRKQTVSHYIGHKLRLIIEVSFKYIRAVMWLLLIGFVFVRNYAQQSMPSTLETSHQLTAGSSPQPATNFGFLSPESELTLGRFVWRTPNNQEDDRRMSWKVDLLLVLAKVLWCCL